GIWLLAVNGMIGSGIFGVPGAAARLGGDWAPWLYLGCAVLILPILLSFGELASRVRHTGGPMDATVAFGPLVGFQAGWLFYVARLVATAAGSILFLDNLAYFWPAANVGGTRLALLACILASLTLVAVAGSRGAIRALGSVTALKLAIPLVLVAVGMPELFADAAPPALPGPDTHDLGAATLLLMFAFVGFESAVVPAGEARRPERDMPWALLVSLAIVGVLYFAIQGISQASFPGLADSSAPLLDVADALLGRAGALMLMAGMLVSTLGSLVGATFSTPRITYALALDGRLPAWFGHVHPRFLTPANSTVAYSGVTFLLAVTGSFAWLAAGSVLMRLLIYIVVCTAVPVLRRKSVAPGSFTLPGGMLIPLGGVIASAWLLTQVSGDAMRLTLAFVVAGSLLYWVARRGSASSPATTPAGTLRG
ncbi:MAG TPA: APC family permease, partial [Vicinamibacterales bacterium]